MNIFYQTFWIIAVYRLFLAIGKCSTISFSPSWNFNLYEQLVTVIVNMHVNTSSDLNSRTQIFVFALKLETSRTYVRILKIYIFILYAILSLSLQANFCS